MREKLIELIIDAKRLDPETGSFTEFLVDHLIANGVTFATDTNVGNKWIPVTDRLPEAGTKALCYLKRGEYWTAVWDDCGDDLWSDGEAWCSNGEVTHWMPLPKAPEEE